jgi:hypothetical protein
VAPEGGYTLREIRLLAPNGNLGSGYLVSSLKNGLAADPDLIACDSGSTDGGPSYLGTGKPYFPRNLYVRDLSHILEAAVSRRVPLIVGSAGGAGVDAGVDFVAEIAREIASRKGLTFRLARIYSEQPKPYILAKLAEGKINPLWPSAELAPNDVDRAERVVGMMGCEPIMAALEGGADVIVAGRCSDTALFAALPLVRGFSPGPVWHAGKILECGAAATVHRLVPDCMMAAVREDHFIVWPPNPEMRCSTLSVAAQMLYENANPYVMREPAGTLITTECKYEQLDDRSVKVSGSQFEEADIYTIKLEGVELVGFHSIVITGIRDPMILASLDAFLSEVRLRTEDKISETLDLTPSDYQLHFKIYGRNGVMGSLERVKTPPHEVGIVFSAFAPTQEAANTVVSTARYVALHNPVPEWHGMVTNLASPFSPEVMARGPAYRFSLNHVVEPADPIEMFRTEFEDVLH